MVFLFNIEFSKRCERYSQCRSPLYNGHRIWKSKAIMEETKDEAVITLAIVQLWLAIDYYFLTN